MIRYPEILDEVFEPESWAWTDRETILYALSIGYGADPSSARDAPFVREETGLKVCPSFVTVAGASGAMTAKRLGINRLKRVHGEQGMVLHRPLPTEGAVTTRSRIVACYDKGPAGALIISETEVRSASDCAHLATLTSTSFARADGGFGGPPGGPAAPARPERPADRTVEVHTRPDQAILFRLLRDRNPLHIDPDRAALAGFPRPILHGLCLYGIACRLLLAEYADNAPERMRAMHTRFAGPVFPGETLRFQLWRDGSTVSFEADVPARQSPALRLGRATLQDAA